MKNFMKFGLVMAMLFGMAVSAFANTTDFSLRVTGSKGKTVSFVLQQAKDVTISIYSTQEEILFAEKVDTDGYLRKAYDLSSFPNGTYTLSAESPTSVSRYEITVDKGEAKISDVDAISKPMVVTKKDRVSLSIINKHDTPIEISLFDANGEELYRQSFEGVSLVKMFNFEKVPAGQFTFVTRYSKKTFTDTITVGN